MASSGTITNAIRTGYAIQIAWTVDSQSVANNTSSVTAKVQLVSTGSSYTINSSASKSGSLTINGTKYSFTFSAALSGNQTKTIYTKTVTVPHGTDGSKTCSFSCVAGINVTLSGTYYGNVTASGSGVFNTIARASSIASVTSSVAINGTNTCTVSITRASSSFTHTVKFAFGSYSYSATGVGTSTSYAIPLSWMNGMPSSTSGTATVTVTTYSGSTKIGTAVSKNFTLSVPSSIVPSISSVSIAEAVSGLADKFGAYIQNKSKLKVTTSAAGSYSSTIKTYKTTINSVNYSGATITSGILNKSGSVTVSITVTDSRGRTASTTRTVTVLAYTSPKISSFSVFRSDASGVQNYDGNRATVKMNFAIASLNSKNDKSYKVEYKAKTSSTWTQATSGSVYSYNSALTLTVAFSTESSFDIRLTITDYYGSATATADIPTAFTLLDFKASGKGLAFGKVAERDNAVEFGLEAYSSDGQFVRFPRALQNNEDLNALLIPGYYVIGSTAVSGTILNKPLSTTETALIEVLWGGTGVQKFQRFSVCDKADHEVYQRIYYGDSWGSWYRIDSFQTDWTLLTLESAFANYSGLAVNQPRVKRQGSMVCIAGIITPTASITGSTTIVPIATLPEAFRPTIHNREFVCQGSGGCVWNFGIATNGQLRFSRYRNGDAYAVANNNTWLPFHATYMI